MSENVPANVQLDNGNGSITFAEDVVATIAGLAATEVEGVNSMGAAAGGIADVFSRKSGKGLTRGVGVKLAEGSVAVNLTIVVDYGSPVPEVAGNIQENVKKAIETMSGLTVTNVDVYVQAVSFEREKSSATAIEMNARPLLQKADAPQGEAAQGAEEAREVEIADGEIAPDEDEFEWDVPGDPEEEDAPGQGTARKEVE